MGVRGLISVNVGVLDMKRFENHWCRATIQLLRRTSLHSGFTSPMLFSSRHTRRNVPRCELVDLLFSVEAFPTLPMLRFKCWFNTIHDGIHSLSRTASLLEYFTQHIKLNNYSPVKFCKEKGMKERFVQAQAYCFG